MTIDWQHHRQQLPLLHALPAQLRESARLQSFGARETLHLCGEKPRVMLCVLSGEIRLVRYDTEGHELVMQRICCGFAAEASMTAKTYHCDIITAESGQLLRFPISAFRRALDEDRSFRDAWLQTLAREVRKLRAQSERLRLNGAAERICHFLETEGENGSITLKQSRKDWAAELGLSHEALYRTLRRLREQGRLRINGETFTLG